MSISKDEEEPRAERTCDNVCNVLLLLSQDETTSVSALILFAGFVKCKGLKIVDVYKVQYHRYNQLVRYA